MTRTAPGESTEAPPRSVRRLGIARGLVHAARPRQWLKNVLVLAAPTFAGVLGEPSAVLATALAFAAFCLAASGTYLINDVRDVEADRAHPRKRHRPIASGAVGVGTAVTAGVLALLAAIGVSALSGSLALVGVLVAYVALTTSYSLWLKHIVILDLMGVAAGFVLRAVAGAAAVQVEVSSWFLIVATLGSLLIVAGKREAELHNSGVHRTEGAASRATLGVYTSGYLRYVRSTTSGALLVSYCLWALSLHAGTAQLLFGLSIVPVSVGILRYAMLVDRGQGESPEELFLRDRMLLLSGLVVAVLLAAGVYVV